MPELCLRLVLVFVEKRTNCTYISRQNMSVIIT